MDCHVEASNQGRVWRPVETCGDVQRSNDVPWEDADFNGFHRISMEFQWDFNGISMGFQWDFNGISMGFYWGFNCISWSPKSSKSWMTIILKSMT